MPITHQYTLPVKRLETEEDMLSVLRDVRNVIMDASQHMEPKNFTNILRIIEIGKYEASDKSEVDLKQAKDFANSYRRCSEGGCQSCTQFAKENLMRSMEPQDSFSYCHIHENTTETPKVCGYGCGFSPMIKKHFSTPCEDWNPTFSKTLNQLIKETGE